MISTGTRLALRDVLLFSFATFAPLSAFLLIDRGLEMGDEGYYLNFLRHPEAYDMTTFFAIVYQPFMQLAQGDFAVVRVLNFLSLYFSALVFAFATVWSLLRDRFSKSHAILTAMTIAGVVVLYLRMWLPTPNYNSLNLLGLLWFGTGVVLIFGVSARSMRILALVSLGVGIGLSGAAKPTTGIALVVVATILLIVKKLSALEYVVLGAAAIAVVAPLIFFFGGLRGFLQNLERATEAVSIFGGGQLDFLSWERFAVRPDIVGVFVIISLFLLLALGVQYREFSKERSLFLMGLPVAAILFFFLMNQFWTKSSSFLELAASAPALVLIWLAWRDRHRLSRLQAGRGAAIVLLSALPLAYVFGTGTNYLKSAGAASIFWVAAIAILVFSLGQKRTSAISFSAVVSAFVIVSLSLSVHLPFRQDASLFDQSFRIDNGSSLSHVKVSKERLEIIRSLEQTFNLVDPASNPVIIDLTGNMPSAIAILDGFQPGMPWLMTGYSGSNALFQFSFSGVDFAKFDLVYILHSEDLNSPANASLIDAIGLSGEKLSENRVVRGTITGFFDIPTDGLTEDLRVTAIRPSAKGS